MVNYLESLGRDARLAGLSGPGALPEGNSEDERRMGKFCDCAIPRTAGKAPVWDTTLAAGEGERFGRRGAEVFIRNCAGCHGRQGLGDGPAAVALIPTPRNLATAQFSDRSLSESLWNGVRGSSMPSWSDLPSGELRGLVAYLKTIAPTEPPPDLTALERATGKAIYVKQCAVCHGQTGAGDGPTAASLAPAPTNFHEVQPTVEYAQAALANGVQGSAMPKWGPKLTPAEALTVGPLRSVVLWEVDSGVTGYGRQYHRRRRHAHDGRVRHCLARVPSVPPVVRGPEAATAGLGPTAPSNRERSPVSRTERDYGHALTPFSEVHDEILYIAFLQPVLSR